MSDLDFKKLSPEQEKALWEILAVCRYLSVSRTWNLSDEMLARQAREIAIKTAQLEKLSA
jgi:hypothetical protein